MNDKDEKNQQYSAAGASTADQADRRFLTGFDDNDDFEESDRDTDYTSAYREDILEEEEFDDPLFEEDPLEETDWAEPLLREVPSEPDPEPALADDDQWSATDPSAAVSNTEEADAWDWEQEEEQEEEQDQDEITVSDPLPGSAAEDFQAPEEDNWDDGDEYLEEEETEEEGGLLHWPLGLVAIAIIALLLLTLGGYGVVQQRAETQEQIRQLQSALATSVDPEEAGANRQALQEAEQRLGELQAVIDVLTMENRRLTDTAAGLESQLTAQQEALASQVETKLPAAASEPDPAPKPVAKPQAAAATKPEPAPKAPPKARPETRIAKATPAAAAPPSPPAAASSAGGWFVNFASYGVADTADNWVAKLQPSAGKPVVSTTNKNGRTYYRVRVVDLPDRAAADRVARELATKYALPKLWVGRE